MSAKLMEYFNKNPRLGTLSTSSRDGKVDVACFGSPRMVDEKTVVISMAKNRTFANLQENPFAVYMIMEPGKVSFGLERGSGLYEDERVFDFGSYARHNQKPDSQTCWRGSSEDVVCSRYF